jgi:hypothetical protein
VRTPASSAAALDDDWKTKIEAEMAMMKAQISRLQELVGTVR